MVFVAEEDAQTKVLSCVAALSLRKKHSSAKFVRNLIKHWRFLRGSCG